MTLGDALRAHRAAHPGCDRHCGGYLAIARDYTAARRISTGPVMAYTFLSVRERKG